MREYRNGRVGAAARTTPPRHPAETRIGGPDGTGKMNKKMTLPLHFDFRQLIHMITVLLAGVAVRQSFAEDWGADALVPASAPALVLEAVGSGTSEGTVVSIGRPAGTANQKWVITPKGNNLYSIKPSYSFHPRAWPRRKVARRTALPSCSKPIVVGPGSDGESRKTKTDLIALFPGMPLKKGSIISAGGRTRGRRSTCGRTIPAISICVDHQASGRAPSQGGEPARSRRAPAPMSRPRSNREAVLTGELKNCTFSTSMIFPGTVRQVTVFIPAQYDGSKPACVYVKTDGYQPQRTILAGDD